MWVDLSRGPDELLIWGFTAEGLVGPLFRGGGGEPADCSAQQGAKAALVVLCFDPGQASGWSKGGTDYFSPRSFSNKKKQNY